MENAVEKTPVHYAPVTFEELVANNEKFRKAAVREVARGVDG